MNDVRNQRQRSQSNLLVEDLHLEDPMEDLGIHAGGPVDVCRIDMIPVNTDLVGDEEQDLERFNRLRTLVRAGKYRVNATSLAAAILASGDLE